MGSAGWGVLPRARARFGLRAPAPARSRFRGGLCAPVELFSVGTTGLEHLARNAGDRGGLSGQQHPPVFIYSPSFSCPFPFCLVAILAQQLQIIPIQRNIGIVNILRRQRYFVVHFQGLLLRAHHDQSPGQAPLAHLPAGFHKFFSAPLPCPAAVKLIRKLLMHSVFARRPPPRRFPRRRAPPPPRSEKRRPPKRKTDAEIIFASAWPIDLF